MTTTPALNDDLVQSARNQLALIHSLANDTTEANWADKRLYLMQTCVRLSDDLAALEAQAKEIEALRAALEWQPIETAPKDRDVLLARVVVEDGEVRSHVSQGRWIDGEEDQSDQPGHDAGFVDCDYGCFFPGRSFGQEKYRFEAKQPTHWMPLPNPPVERTALKGA